jgi:hypothetical protein
MLVSLVMVLMSKYLIDKFFTKKDAKIFRKIIKANKFIDYLRDLSNSVVSMHL